MHHKCAYNIINSEIGPRKIADFLTVYRKKWTKSKKRTVKSSLIFTSIAYLHIERSIYIIILESIIL